MAKPRYRIVFFFHERARVSLHEIARLLRRRRELTFTVVEDEEAWHHRRYDSDIIWKHDTDANILTATVSSGEAVRTCGSLVEWMLRNAPDYLGDVDRDLKSVSIIS